MPDDKEELEKELNKAMWPKGEKVVNWSKLTIREMMDVYSYVTGRAGGSSQSGMAGIPVMRDKIMGLVDGLSADEADMVMSAIQKRRESLKSFPLLNHLLTNFQKRSGDDDDKK